MGKADFVENLAEILTKQDVDDWVMLLRHSPEIYWMLMKEFESEVHDEVRTQARS